MKSFKDFLNEQSLRISVDVKFNFLNKPKEEFFNACKKVLPVNRNTYFCFTDVESYIVYAEDNILSIIKYQLKVIKNIEVAEIKVSLTAESARGRKLGFNLYKQLLEYYKIINDYKNSDHSIEIYKKLNKDSNYKVLIFDIKTGEIWNLKEYSPSFDKWVWVNKGDKLTSDDIYRRDNFRVMVVKK